MPAASYDAESVYGPTPVPLHYRSPASAQALPETLADSNQARTLIPLKPGACISHPSTLLKLSAAAEVAHILLNVTHILLN